MYRFVKVTQRAKLDLLQDEFQPKLSVFESSLLSSAVEQINSMYVFEF